MDVETPRRSTSPPLHRVGTPPKQDFLPLGEGENLCWDYYQTRLMVPKHYSSAIIGGPAARNTSKTGRKSYARLECQSSNHSASYQNGDVITFSNDDLIDVEVSHKDVVVITMVMDKINEVERVLVDTRSLVDVLYYHAFKAMNLSEKRLRPIKFSLINFSGDAVKVKGSIILETRVRTKPRRATISLSYLVVDISSSHLT
ncbi:hypothetical protein NE237_022248 [Protea cynaroides]|uniref:Uncharacterized protein n=1 Tax=Protea cynaroides TaxID=273540 RepID=A0A9Q0HAN2_9MAGN|nr:hypothetical protein NE237_022248 [Protea cynaroides]